MAEDAFLLYSLATSNQGRAASRGVAPSKRKEEEMLNLRTLGLLAVAALVMSAMAANGAQAQVKGIFTTGLTPGGAGNHTASTVHGVQEGTQSENYLELNGAKISCSNAQTTYKIAETGGTKTSGTDKSVTVTPEYKGCGTLNAAGELTNELVTFTMNECDFKFSQPIKLAANEYTGTADLNCPVGKSIVLDIFANAAHTIKVCEVTTEPAQTGLQHVIYRNIDRGDLPDHVTAEVTVDGIKYENRLATCPGGAVTKQDLIYRSKVTITSTETFHDVWISDEE